MKRALLLVLLLGFSYSFAETYPISPRPLRKLIKESEYIVIAKVSEISSVEESDIWASANAHLKISETLQGTIDSEIIQVSFNPGLVCPAPANYPKGKTVIAFLDKDKEGGYTTHALSYGTKVVDETGIAIYRARILEMQEIQKIKNKRMRREATLDWLVSCIVEPVTRWEGTYELSPESDFMSFYDRSKDDGEIFYLLSKDQQKKIKKALYETEVLEYSDIGLIDMVMTQQDEELDRFLVTKFKAMFEKNDDSDQIWMAGFFMYRIAYLKDDSNLEKIAEEFEEYGGVDYKKDQKRKRKLLEDFLSHL
ncbi:hypothetical protein ACFQ1M_14145 [Sungkyunkwania multivorans]|uniref:Uncharacterized protein n=1 Tax=Sungkyunkwania multivorans TaxID=1173618 RepID=A0ABW3D0N5_9FLAO